jgi:hypothetical protein
MNTQRASEIQAVLEGVPLPASRRQLLDYARAQDASIVRELERLPEETFDHLDAVGERLTVQPEAPAPPADTVPRPESGKPPGGDDYLTAFPADTGRVRHSAPRDNPPQKAIEQASELQKQQKQEQGG